MNLKLFLQTWAFFIPILFSSLGCEYPKPIRLSTQYLGTTPVYTTFYLKKKTII